jgi:hypothetical protein
MAEHSAEVTVNAPAHQVYQLYTHFNDYPKFMTFVKEVTYLDDKRSHWVVDIVGRHEWDAVNEDWIPDEQVGWRSVDGLANSGRVEFRDLTADRTAVLVTVAYVPPAGLLGNIGEALGAGNTFEQRLQHDLEHFARMVEEAPAGALDPTSSAYLFHADSAAARGDATPGQRESMGMREGASNPEAPASTTAVSEPRIDEALNDPSLPRIPGTSPPEASKN